MSGLSDLSANDDSILPLSVAAQQKEGAAEGGTEKQ
jgi:hypothetical protein